MLKISTLKLFSINQQYSYGLPQAGRVSKGKGNMAKAQTDYYAKTTRSMLSCVKEVGAMPFLVYQFYLTFHEIGEHLPTLEETAEHFGIVKSAVSNHNKKLLKNGWIRKQNERFICTYGTAVEPYREPDTYLYLMQDKVNGFIKIGISKDPKYRERTLQSEKPTIELLDAWLGSKKDEIDLHRTFAENRVRGEWFNLDQWEILSIRLSFGSRKRLED